MNPRLVKALLAVALVAGLVAVAIGSGSDPGAGPSATTAADVGAGARVAPRTVVVSTGRMPSASRPGAPLHALQRSGPVPDRAQTATVLTDADCAPNARGLSNCLNRLRLADGRTLTVRHPHRMMDVPCLSPGERVTVRRA